MDPAPSCQHTALITGGSSGVGFALAKELARNNVQLILVARGEEGLEQARVKLAASGATVSVISADISTPAGIEKIRSTLKSGLKLNSLINCAGIVTPALLTDQTPEQINAQIATNLLGTIHLTRALLNRIPSGGIIINISSGLGFFGFAGYTAYSASKFGIIGFSEALRRELLSKKILVHCSCLGEVDTPQYQNEQEEMPNWMQTESRGAPTSPDIVAKRILKAVRTGKPFSTPDRTMTLLNILSRHTPRLSRAILDRVIPRPK